MNSKELRRLELEISELQSSISKSEGVIAEIEERLKTEFQCENLSEAEQLQSKLQRQIQKLRTTLDKKLEKGKRKWKDVLK